MSLEGKATAGQELKGRINAIDILTLSAYGIAVKHGFEGTEEEWLDSLSLSDDEIRQAVNEYLDTHPVYIDKTLSVSDMAADAKVTGDAINEVVEAVEAVEATAYAANKEAKDAADDAMNAANTAQAIADAAQATADTVAGKLGGCWIEFTDEDGNPTDEPYIHWTEEV